MTIQFADRKQYPVSAAPTAEGWKSTGLDFADYGRMGTQQRKQSGERRLPTPRWAVNDDMLQKLLVHFMEERAGIKKKKGTLSERLIRAQENIQHMRPKWSATLDDLCRKFVRIRKFGAYSDLADEEVLQIAEDIFGNRPLMVSDASGLGARQMLTHKLARDWSIEIEGLDTLLRYTEKDGGAATVAAVAWLYYRVGMDSVGVGSELGLKPPHVRQILFRLHETAEKLWPSQAEGNGGVGVNTLNAEQPKTREADGTGETIAAGDDANGKPAISSTRAGLSTPPLF